MARHNSKGLAGGTNLYAYGGGDPINHIDPDGADWRGWVAAHQDDLVSAAQWGALGIGFVAGTGGTGAAIIAGRFIASRALGLAMSGAVGLAAGIGAGITRARDVAAGCGSVANNASDAVMRPLLSRQLASQEQVGQILSGGGRAIAGAGTSTPLRDAARLAAEWGGRAADWAKVASSNRFGFEVHAYQNLATGQVVELKTKLPPF